MKSTFFTLFSVLSYVSSEQFSENVHLEKDLKVEGNTELQGSVSLEGPVHITGKVNFGDSSVDAMTLLNNIQERLNGIENMFVHNDDGSLDLIPDVNFRGNVKFLGDSESVSQKDTQEPTQEATQEPTQEATQEPTQESTQEPTQESTQEPAQEATQEPTQEATQELHVPRGPPGCETCQTNACIETCLEQQDGQDVLGDFDGF